MNPQGDGDGPNRANLLYASQKNIFCRNLRGRTRPKRYTKASTSCFNIGCDCFRRNEIVVGISVDGPEDIHDAHRRFRDGRGSHAMAMRGIEALHRNQVPFHCISVITADAMEQPERMYRFIETMASMMWVSMLKRRKESKHHLQWQAQIWRLSIKIFSERFGV